MNNCRAAAGAQCGALAAEGRPDYVAPRVAPTVAPSAPSAHPLLPLAVLEAVRELDTVRPDDDEDLHEELAGKRLGMSRTVAAQIERFTRLTRTSGRVDAEELVALLRLVGRRHDAALVFSDAGRRAGRRAVQGAAGSFRASVRFLPRPLRNRIGFALMRRRARAVFHAAVRLERGVPEVGLEDPTPIRATPTGAACAFYGSALAEMLRRLTDFDGAMLHVTCRGRGDAACVWRAAAS